MNENTNDGTSEDARIAAKIHAALDAELAVGAGDIRVAVRDGVVTLSGRVPYEHQCEKAEEAVWGVRGVRALVHHVKAVGEELHSDERIASVAVERIAERFPTTSADIRIKVLDGWVTLCGEVPTREVHDAITELVDELAGVHGVANELTLEGESGSDTVRRRIEHALHRRAEIELGELVIRLEGERVTLDGHVADPDERAAIREAARSAPGVTEVVDNLAR